MQSAPKHVIVHHNIWHILVTSKTWFLFVLISSWWLFLSLKNVFFIRTFTSQFIEKGFMKTENSECSVLLLLFLFTQKNVSQSIFCQLYTNEMLILRINGIFLTVLTWLHLLLVVMCLELWAHLLLVIWWPVFEPVVYSTPKVTSYFYYLFNI